MLSARWDGVCEARRPGRAVSTLGSSGASAARGVVTPFAWFTMSELPPLSLPSVAAGLSSCSSSTRSGVAAPLSLEIHSSSSVSSERAIEKPALRDCSCFFDDKGVCARFCCNGWSPSFDWTLSFDWILCEGLKWVFRGYGEVFRWGFT